MTRRWHIQSANRIEHLSVEFETVDVGYVQPSNTHLSLSQVGEHRAETYFNLFTAIVRLFVYRCDRVKEHPNSQPDMHKSGK